MNKRPTKKRVVQAKPDLFRGMRPEDRVNLAVQMSSVVTTITLESILDRNPRISKARLLEEARKRFHSGRRTP